MPLQSPPAALGTGRPAPLDVLPFESPTPCFASTRSSAPTRSSTAMRRAGPAKLRVRTLTRSLPFECCTFRDFLLATRAGPYLLAIGSLAHPLSRDPASRAEESARSVVLSDTVHRTTDRANYREERS